MHTALICSKPVLNHHCERLYTMYLYQLAACQNNQIDPN